MIEYRRDEKIQNKLVLIARKLAFNWIDLERVIAVRSHGSKSRRTLARCHALSRIMQESLGIRGHYVIEIISENFDKLSEEDKVKTLIHELMHIPGKMGGGFRHHRNHVTRKAVDRMYGMLTHGLC